MLVPSTTSTSSAHVDGQSCGHAEARIFTFTALVIRLSHRPRPMMRALILKRKARRCHGPLPLPLVGRVGVGTAAQARTTRAACWALVGRVGVGTAAQTLQN